MSVRRLDDGQILSKERHQEMRRLRGEISCAECRRLKLKCDRKVPCSSCTKRGCHFVCPNGTFIGSQNASAKVSQTDSSKIQRRANDLSDRIRQLEHSLQISHARLSEAPHPLLTDELLAIKQGFHVPTNETSDGLQGAVDKETMEAFGTLSVMENADLFEGIRAREERLAHLPSPEPKSRAQDRVPTQSFYYDATGAWPFRPVGLSEAEFRLHVARNLPSYERANALCEAYLCNLTWFMKPIEREQLVEELLPMVYGTDSFSGRGTEACESVPMHSIGLLLAVFATGSAGDLSLPQYNEEAETFYLLATAALNIKSILDGGLENPGVTFETVQAVSLLGSYHMISARKESIETCALIMNIAHCLAAGIGLHRDPGRWDLSPKIVQRRRTLFWELYSNCSWHSISFGRPAVFCSHNYDCEFPEDEHAKIVDGKQISGYWRSKYIFAKEVVGHVAERMSVASPMKYSEILKLDRSAREFYVQEYRQSTVDPLLGQPNIMDMVQRITSVAHLEILSLVIHRNFFAKAIIDYPSNPMQSPFAYSFLSAYHSATAVMNFLRKQHEDRPRLTQRMFLIRTHALSAFVIVASVAIRTPASEIAKNAVEELAVALDLFERMADHPTTRPALPYLRRLYETAQRLTKVTPKQPGVPLQSSVGNDKLAATQANYAEASGSFICEQLPIPARSAADGLPPEHNFSSYNYSTPGLTSPFDPAQLFPAQLVGTEGPNADYLRGGSAGTFDELLAAMDVDMNVDLTNVWGAFTTEQNLNELSAPGWS